MEELMVTIPKKEYDELMEIAINAQTFVRYANGARYIEREMCNIFFPEIQVKESDS